MADRLEVAIQEQVDQVSYLSLDSLRVYRDGGGAAITWTTPEGVRLALLDADGKARTSEVA